MQYTYKALRNVLANATTILQQAGIARLWVDTSGSGWTESFKIYIESKDTMIKKVAAIQYNANGFRESIGQMFERAYLSNEVKQVIQTILADFDLGDRLIWEFDASQNVSNLGVAIWPPSERRELLENQLQKLKVEIDELKNLEKDQP